MAEFLSEKLVSIFDRKLQKPFRFLEVTTTNSNSAYKDLYIHAEKKYSPSHEKIIFWATFQAQPV